MLIVLESRHGTILSLVDTQIGKQAGRQNMYVGNPFLVYISKDYIYEQFSTLVLIMWI
jgi:hypothetical protein